MNGHPGTGPQPHRKPTAGTWYFLVVSLIFLGLVIPSISSLHGEWPAVIVVAVFITVLDISVANVAVASITLTSSLVLASTTNFGLFPTELSLLLSLPYLLIHYRRVHLPIVIFNTSMYGISAILASAAYRSFGGVLGDYSHHENALFAYMVVYAIMNFTLTTLGLALTYWGTGQLTEVFRHNEFQITATYLLEMVLGTVAGVLYQTYGMLGMVIVFGVLLIVIQTYKRYFDIAYRAEIDDLTGLLNRGAFLRRLVRYLKRGTSFSVHMIDIDYFKKVNDSFGHQKGDMVLREIAAVLKHEVGRQGIIARYGGEEFCLVSESQSAHRLSEQLRVAVQEHGFELAPDLHLTISIGISTYPDDAAGWEDLLKCADMALYEAKRVRNVIKMYSPVATADPTAELS